MHAVRAAALMLTNVLVHVVQDITALAAENADLRQQLASLRLDFNILRQDVETIRHQVFLPDGPSFGSLPSINGALNGGFTASSMSMMDNGHTALSLPIASSQSSQQQQQPTIEQQHHFGAFPVQPVEMRPPKEGMVLIGGHDGKWLTSCSTFTPGDPTSPACMPCPFATG